MDQSADDFHATGAQPDAVAPAGADWVHANLAALAALLNIDHSESFSELFAAMHALFGFDGMLVLDEADGGLRCIAAYPDDLNGRQWPGESLRDRFDVRTLPAGGAQDPGDDLLSELAPGGEPMLCLPVGVDGRPALIFLLRTAEFSATEIAAGRNCSAVSLATLAANRGSAAEAELAAMNKVLAQANQEARDAQHNCDLLRQIVDHLPIGVTVQDDSGRFILANALAATNLATPADLLLGASPGDFLPEAEAASRREWEQNIIHQRETIATEGIVPGDDGERTWLTWHKPVNILDRTLLMSSSVDITEHKQVERALVERAHIDQLTGLPNRILIQEQVDTIVHNDDGRRRFALAFIDVDNFKHINDYYSHAVGDGLLVKIGQRISRRLRPGDVLARISGDEFLLLLDPFDDDGEVRSIIDGVLDDLKQPFHIDAFEVFSSCSIGVSVYPDHGRSYEALRRNADNAMYRAKHVAKGGAVFFDLEMGRAMTTQMEVEQRLRLAIRDQRFCCAFQPKVDIHTHDVVGVETLVRWRDDDGEIHPPGNFIGLAVELGLINPITNFVLADAIASMDRLDAAFGPGVTVSINVAAAQANDLEFMQSFAGAIKDSGCAERIIVELTEDAFIAKGDFQTKVLPILREIGVRVSIDDFGTGYSSLSTLADITADEIKIDRSFISSIHERPRNQIVLRAIESLGHALGMTIVAEGVETYEELAYLHATTRIRYAQGYYFARPIFLEDLSNAKRIDIMDRAPEAPRTRFERSSVTTARSSTPARSE
jgi:diguanylate cyclase (GGDEF)-like protein/PAS domain S-box-containing protein